MGEFPGCLKHKWAGPVCLLCVREGLEAKVEKYEEAILTWSLRVKHECKGHICRATEAVDALAQKREALRRETSLGVRIVSDPSVPPGEVRIGYLDPKPSCPKCGDSGSKMASARDADGKMYRLPIPCPDCKEDING